MLPKRGSYVEFPYTDAQGEHRVWRGKVHKDKGSHFTLETEEGYRTFRSDRVEGDIEELP